MQRGTKLPLVWTILSSQCLSTSTTTMSNLCTLHMIFPEIFWHKISCFVHSRHGSANSENVPLIIIIISGKKNQKKTTPTSDNAPTLVTSRYPLSWNSGPLTYNNGLPLKWVPMITTIDSQPSISLKAGDLGCLCSEGWTTYIEPTLI